MVHEAETIAAGVGLQELVAAFTAAVRCCDAAGEDLTWALATGDLGQIAAARSRTATAAAELDNAARALARQGQRLTEARNAQQDGINRQILRSFDADVAVLNAHRASNAE